MYQFYPQLVLRMPASPFYNYHEANLQHLLKDPYFQAAICLASAVLYQELAKKNFEVAALSPEVLFTLRKYLNRMCFRPTPFGLFSGVATATWGGGNNTLAVVHTEGLKAVVSLGYGEVMKLANELLLQELAPYHMYRSNTSFYRVKDEIRYVRYENDTGSGKRNFFVDALGYNTFLQSLLTFCQSGKSKEAVVHFIKESLAANEEEGCAFFEQLTAQQLLLSTLEPTITGEDYLGRLLRLCASLHLDTPRVNHVRQLLEKLDTVSGVAGKENIGNAILGLYQSFSHLKKAKSPLYVNLDLGKAAGGLDISYQTCLLEGLECLNRLLPTQQPQGLQHFADAFSKKFEGRAVPLLVALDPEIGVGYEALASGYSSPKLLEEMHLAVAGEHHPTIKWTPAHALLMEKWQNRTHAMAAIHLNKQEVERLPVETKTGKLPPTTSVLFRVHRGKVFIEQAGGASATALLGRFTPVSEKIDNMAKALAAQEQKANPHVLFAEIAHTSDAHTANIDRRNVIREFEIPVLVQATLPLERQIPLSDLWVRVEAGQVVLFSQKLQKEIIPRLGSAFNYIRNDLSFFRFLCDLQYQGLKANFTLDLHSFFPGMGFYPRVAYRSTILHLATWHLKKEQFASVLAVSGKQALQALRQLAAEQGWPRYIAFTEHDHQLVIDLQQEDDLVSFIQEIRKKAQVVVKEFPFVDESAAVVADEKQKPFIHQFMAALYHEQEVYPASRLPVKARQGTKKIKRKLLPGNEWLYFKIYCHPSRSNQILTDSILPVVNRLQKQGTVRQWFYVRYRDPEYHIRVRLAVSPAYVGSALNTLHQKLARQLEKGVVRDVQLAVYERELERYGPELMEATEAFFSASSALVAGTIKQHSHEETDFAYYEVGFSGIDAIATSIFTADLAEKAAFFSGLYERFYLEFNGDKVLREQLSATYRVVSRTSILPVFPPDAPKEKLALRKLWHRMQATLQEIEQKAAMLPPERKTRFAADLMHMHLNRLFVDEPRKQEMVAYYCLWRHYKSLIARSKA
ncbi:lantibiotic dehydratase [Pontibacter sp. MBLB2868]|uniref:lantibiotic dehydratase n=1 Tax=Pontibacter sp. MBLB2868 TaxID=3451555 RepID=UPI003F755016